MNEAKRNRLIFIIDHLATGRPINRADVSDRFGCSFHTVVLDFKALRELQPDAMIHDTRARQYVAGPGIAAARRALAASPATPD